ncbi:uncharacterized protein ColSpa_12706 [Colletotrichum spaethianum]|uniref:Uncharacterized protein n=1 Tax=Colletotrichum spaethianum TaxID=700344 RepID=A0AA37PI70_9PEZI|nr:uncharacterized protein ColSpa_12706 [Colletotrichum spaethianum]GKT52525.1 hypothetical protein ColSpa_12706 [Colletotrichum spaethianum]
MINQCLGNAVSDTSACAGDEYKRLLRSFAFVGRESLGDWCEVESNQINECNQVDQNSYDADSREYLEP